MSKVEGIILAAGLSTRLLGENKIWTEIHGAPMISWVVRESLASHLDRVTVVLGPATELRAVVFSDPRLRTVVNLQPEAGMSWSIRSGIASVDSSAAGAAIILGDQPFITAEIIDRLIDTFKGNRNKIVAPLIHGRRSTPVIFPAALFPEVMRISGDVGARDVVNRHAEDVVGLEMGSLYDDTDLDTPDDLSEIRKKMSDRKSGL